VTFPRWYDYLLAAIALTGAIGIWFLDEQPLSCGGGVSVQLDASAQPVRK
jgi:hypothetical protein